MFHSDNILYIKALYRINTLSLYTEIYNQFNPDKNIFNINSIMLYMFNIFTQGFKRISCLIHAKLQGFLKVQTFSNPALDWSRN